MLASITPLGERGRGSTWGVTVMAFLLGATGAGVLAGVLSGAAGGLLVPASAPGGWRLLAAGVGCAVAGVADAVRDPAPGPRRQVDERWLDAYRGWVYGLGYGVQLGVGIATRVTSAALYAAIAIAALTGSAVEGAVVLGIYGAARGATPLLAAGVHTPAELVRLHGALGARAAASRWAAVAVLACAALLAALDVLL